MVTNLSEICPYRRFVVTKTKIMGLVPEETQIGEEIFLLLGGQVFYVLRPAKDHYQLIGECYLHGLMDGQALSHLHDGTARLLTIKIK
jgi:hypothetical protein